MRKCKKFFAWQQLNVYLNSKINQNFSLKNLQIKNFLPNFAATKFDGYDSKYDI